MHKPGSVKYCSTIHCLLYVLQTTASESTFVSLLAARSEAIKRVRQTAPELEDAEINARLVAYCSDQVRTKPLSAQFHPLRMSNLQLSLNTYCCSLNVKQAAVIFEADHQT